MTNTNQEAITEPDLIWRTMEDCPTGPKILLLNKAGIASTGWWDGKDGWWVGWFPLPKIPQEIRQLVEPNYPHSPSNIGALIGD
jgi:hypothetical protein